jgi:hypothetical protein
MGPSPAPSMPVYRFWSSKLGNAHFFTLDEQEKNSIMRFDNADTGGNWKYEGIAFAAFPAAEGSCGGHVPVQRYYSSRFTTHFYTANQGEMNALASDPNWTYETLAYCADVTQVTGGTPVHRYWSPRFQKHFFTASESERAALIQDPNWAYEGVAFYVQPVTN